MIELLIDKINSEIGEILIVVEDKTLCALDFVDYELRMVKLLNKRYKSVSLVEAKNPYGFSDLIRAYFNGDYCSLDEIPVKTGGTSFQPGLVHFTGNSAWNRHFVSRISDTGG